MNVQDEIAALESEIADTYARIDKVNAEVEAIKRNTIEIRNRVSKIEEDAQKQISDP